MTPQDWELLSAWHDGTLEPSTQEAFERRIASERELALAAERLRALERVARTLAPTAVDVAAWSGTARVPGGPAVGTVVAIVVTILAGATALGLASSRAPSERLEADSTIDQVPPTVAGRLDHDAGGLEVVAAGSTSASSSDLVDAGPPTLPSEPIVLAVGERWLLRGRWALEGTCDQVKLDPFGEDMRSLTGRAAGKCGVRSLEDGGVRRFEVEVVSLPSAERALELLEGDHHALRVPAMTRFSLGSREVASVERTGSELVVRALHRGSTTIEAWFEDGRHFKWPLEVKASERGATHEELLVHGPRIFVSKSYEGYRVDKPAILEVSEVGKSLMVRGRSPGRAVLEVDEQHTAKRFVFDVFASYSRDELLLLPRVDIQTVPSVLHLRVGTVAVFRVGDVSETTIDSPWLVVEQSGASVYLTALRPVEATLLLGFRDRTLRRIRVVADR